MKSARLFYGSFFLPFIVFGQQASESLDAKINEHFSNATSWFTNAVFAEIPITNDVGIPWVLIVLIVGASYFTGYFKFINIRGFFTAINVVKGSYDNLEENQKVVVSEAVSTTENNDQPDTIRVEGTEGEVSHFQALTAALSATVGLGNIAGVAIALSIGGPGATFWMILVGFLGMASKFVECTLGVKYREVDENGVVFGGPM
jgi:AGCS family alanine or glycine:cation symporter